MDVSFIGQRITELRMKRGDSEYEMSLSLGNSKSYIQGITSGKTLPSMEQLFNICDYFQISLAEFFCEKETYLPAYYSLTAAAKKLNERDTKLLLEMAERLAENQPPAE